VREKLLAGNHCDLNCLMVHACHRSLPALAHARFLNSRQLCRAERILEAKRLAEEKAKIEVGFDSSLST
jgi:hypothetical protein